MSTETANRVPVSANVDGSGGRLARRCVQLIAATTVAFAMVVGLAGAASADVATSWGFTCDVTYNTLHQNWPNISTRSATDSEVYTRALLYRWNGQHWVQQATSSWYVGVSNVTGRKALGYLGGLPYYFALPGRPSLVLDNTGYVFKGMRNGYYKTREQY